MRFLASITYPPVPMGKNVRGMKAQYPAYVTLDAKDEQKALEVIRESEPAVKQPTEVQVRLWPMTVTRFMRQGVYSEVAHGTFTDHTIPLREA